MGGWLICACLCAVLMGESSSSRLRTRHISRERYRCRVTHQRTLSNLDWVGVGVVGLEAVVSLLVEILQIR